MTLIELLVVITILTTLVAGVIPLLSPNNEPRKLREAARELQSYITQTQAEAARTGRPHGIGFRESAAGSGAALEVFQLEIPQPFAGFSEFSRARLFSSGFVQFIFVDAPTTDPFPTEYEQELIPPLFLRRGDLIEIDNVLYRIDDGDKNGDGNDEDYTDFPNGDFYTFENLPGPNNPIMLEVTPVASTTPLLSYVAGGGIATAPKPYRILRQPANTPEQPLSLPRGVGIDMVASGVDVSIPSIPPALSEDERPPHYGFTSMVSTYETALLNSPPKVERYGVQSMNPIVVGIMFSPSGRINDYYINGERRDSPARMYFLLGRVENIENDPEIHGPEFVDFVGKTDAEVEDGREINNWLNLDSRWVAIDGSSGRMVGAENRFIDPRDPSLIHPDPLYEATRALRINAARQYAREMRREGGR